MCDTIAPLGIAGVHDETEYWRYYPSGDVMSQVLGFTGDHDVGQEGMELAEQSWLGGKPGTRRVIINRRGEIVFRKLGAMDWNTDEVRALLKKVS